MKTIITFVLISFIYQTSVTDSIKVGDVKTIVLKTDNSTKKQEKLKFESILIIAIPSIISLIGFYLLSIDVKKQIQLSKEQFRKQNRVRYVNEFKSLIVKLLTELDPSNGVNYGHHRNTGFYSDKHQLLHYELLMFLDNNNRDENMLVLELEKLSSEKNNLSESLIKITKLGSLIINFRNRELI